MKKLLFVLTMICSLFASSVFAATIDERIAKIETKLEQRIEKINKSRYTTERKEMLKKHAKESSDLKIKQMKELNSIKKVKKSPKKNKTSKK